MFAPSRGLVPCAARRYVEGLTLVESPREPPTEGRIMATIWEIILTLLATLAPWLDLSGFGPVA
ncbi:hypothetical protein CZ771_02025 [Actinomycetales bacterium JB111]|nr:hypothetical protein CZ771_02025 [Actinomycetales bacterium JB111]